MDNSVGSTIEMIKLKEHEKKLKLKEQREIETTMASLNKAIREASQQIEKLNTEENDLLIKTNALRAQLELERIRKDALGAQVDACRKELSELSTMSDQNILKVWEMRSSFCETVQNVSDKCDVWALLMRPTCTEHVPNRAIRKTETIEIKLMNEDVLKKATEKRAEMIAERERLKIEPDVGDDFVRIKNALHYSLKMTADLQNKTTSTNY